MKKALLVFSLFFAAYSGQTLCGQSERDLVQALQQRGDEQLDRALFGGLGFSFKYLQGAVIGASVVSSVANLKGNFEVGESAMVIASVSLVSSEIVRRLSLSAPFYFLDHTSNQFFNVRAAQETNPNDLSLVEDRQFLMQQGGSWAMGLGIVSVVTSLLGK